MKEKNGSRKRKMAIKILNNLNYLNKLKKKKK